MRSKSVERTLAEALRREEGLSYSEIAARTGISKSTLSNWLRDIPMRPDQIEHLESRLQANRASFAARAWSANRQRHTHAREEAYLAGASVVRSLPDACSVHELALAMLYLGEGSKTGNRVQLASTAPDILRYFVETLVKLYNVDRQRLSFRLNLVEAARGLEAHLLSWWSAQLQCTRDQFTRTQFDRRSRTVELTQEYAGVCTATYYDTYLQQRILGIAETYMLARFAQVRSDRKRL